MNTGNWFILIYGTADPESQERLARELRGLGGGIVVQTEHSGGDFYVIIESPESIAALTLHEFVVSVDPYAELIDTHHAKPAKTARLEREFEPR